MQPVAHILIPFAIGLMMLTLYRRQNVLFSKQAVDAFILLGLAVGGLWPDSDSIRNSFGIEHRGFFHTWWMAIIWAIVFGIVILLWKRNKQLGIVGGFAFLFGYWSHLILDFHTAKILGYIQIVVDKVVSVRLPNEAEMVLDGVLALFIVIYTLSKGLFGK